LDKSRKITEGFADKYLKYGTVGSHGNIHSIDPLNEVYAENPKGEWNEQKSI